MSARPKNSSRLSGFRFSPIRVVRQPSVPAYREFTKLSRRAQEIISKALSSLPDPHSLNEQSYQYGVPVPCRAVDNFHYHANMIEVADEYPVIVTYAYELVGRTKRLHIALIQQLNYFPVPDSHSTNA